MATRGLIDQIAFRYRTADSTTGVTRDTAKRLAERLGVDETQAIHLALHHMACRRRSNIDPPCRSNIDPGMDADRMTVGCG